MLKNKSKAIIMVAVGLVMISLIMLFVIGLDGQKRRALEIKKRF